MSRKLIFKMYKDILSEVEYTTGELKILERDKFLLVNILVTNVMKKEYKINEFGLLQENIEFLNALMQHHLSHGALDCCLSLSKGDYMHRCLYICSGKDLRHIFSKNSRDLARILIDLKEELRAIEKGDINEKTNIFGW